MFLYLLANMSEMVKVGVMTLSVAPAAMLLMPVKTAFCVLLFLVASMFSESVQHRPRVNWVG